MSHGLILRWGALVALLCLLSPAPAVAAGRPAVESDLVVGRTDWSQPAYFAERRQKLFSAQGLSIGTVTPADQGDGTDKLALGGYIAYMIDDYTLSSAWRGSDFGSLTEFSASYNGPLLGYGGVTALKLGYGSDRPSTLGLDHVQSGLGGFHGIEPYGPRVSLALSWTHDITPGMSLGGFAAASRDNMPSGDSQSDFRIGAGLGIRF